MLSYDFDRPVTGGGKNFDTGLLGDQNTNRTKQHRQHINGLLGLVDKLEGKGSYGNVTFALFRGCLHGGFCDMTRLRD